MNSPFDPIAHSYDSDFTYSRIGRLQRSLVWNYLEKTIPTFSGFEVLELNAGTGEDAILFSQQGFNIVATDVSLEMLQVIDKKVRGYSMQHAVSSQYLDLADFNSASFDKKFDVVFSNFGGLNCINLDSLQELISKIPSILKPGGRFIAVIMPKHCMMESIYFLCKIQFRKVFRRNTNNDVLVDMNGARFPIWYYDPTQLIHLSEKSFFLIDYRPVGFLVPPSYLEKFFSTKPMLLAFLNFFEKKLNRFRQLARHADHYIIDLKLK